MMRTDKTCQQSKMATLPVHFVSTAKQNPSMSVAAIYIRSRDSVVGTATGYGLDDRGVGVRVPVGSTQHPIQWVPGVLSLRVKRPGREAHHSPPACAEITKYGSIHPLPHTPSWRSA
jgi:hypothetical protein